jgi:hypothetical protein
MRLVLAAGLLPMTMTMLGGCGQSDAVYRASYRSQAVASCETGARSAPNAAATGLDFQRLCGCAVDSYMAHTSSADLRSEGNVSEAPPGARSAMMQCLSQMRPNMVPAANGPPAIAPPPPPTPSGDKPS